MKKSVCFLLFACLLFTLCGCSGKFDDFWDDLFGDSTPAPEEPAPEEPAPSVQYADFSDDIYGVTMQYPEDYTLSTEDEELIASFTAPDGNATLSLFTENHMIYSPHMTLDEYMDASQASLSFIKDYKLLEEKDVTVGDLAGKYIRYSGYLDDDESKTVYMWTQFIAIKEGYAYVLTHDTEAALYDDSTLFEEVLQTLTVADNPRYQEELAFYEAYHEELEKAAQAEGENP